MQNSGWTVGGLTCTRQTSHLRLRTYGTLLCSAQHTCRLLHTEAACAVGDKITPNRYRRTHKNSNTTFLLLLPTCAAEWREPSQPRHVYLGPGATCTPTCHQWRSLRRGLVRAFKTGMSFSRAARRRSDSCAALVGVTWDLASIIFIRASNLNERSKQFERRKSTYLPGLFPQETRVLTACHKCRLVQGKVTS